MSATKQSDPLSDFLKTLDPGDTDSVTIVAKDEDPIEELLWSMLLWECSVNKAERALKRIRNAIVDLNELRVCMPEEVVDLLGRGYPLAQERSLALLRSLHDVFNREHSVSLETVKRLPKREARKYLDALDGAPQFVCARVFLIAVGGHAMPLDNQMRSLLVEAGAIDESVDLAQAASLLERRVKASDALATHAALLARSHQGGGAGGRSSGASKSSKKRSMKAAKTA